MPHYVKLSEPLPGIRSTVFLTSSLEDAEALADELHMRAANRPSFTTEVGTAGDWFEVYNPEDMPPIFQVFSQIRAIASKWEAFAHVANNTDILNDAERLKTIGDLDENICALMNDLIDGSITESNLRLAKFMADHPKA